MKRRENANLRYRAEQVGAYQRDVEQSRGKKKQWPYDDVSRARCCSLGRRRGCRPEQV